MKFTGLIGIVTVTTALFVGVSPQYAWSASEEGVASQEAAQEKSVQMARGARYWAEQCKRCHNLRNGAELTDAEWEVAVTHMRVRGNLPGQLARDVMLFLKESN